MGAMHNRHRAYVGVPCDDRDTLSQRQVIAAMLTDQTAQKLMGAWQPDWLGQSIEELAGHAEAGDSPGASQEEHDQEDDQANREAGHREQGA